MSSVPGSPSPTERCHWCGKPFRRWQKKPMKVWGRDWFVHQGKWRRHPRNQAGGVMADTDSLDATAQRWPCCPYDDEDPCPQAGTGHDLPCNGSHCTEPYRKERDDLATQVRSLESQLAEKDAELETKLTKAEHDVRYIAEWYEQRLTEKRKETANLADETVALRSQLAESQQENTDKVLVDREALVHILRHGGPDMGITSLADADLWEIYARLLRELLAAS